MQMATWCKLGTGTWVSHMLPGGEKREERKKGKEGEKGQGEGRREREKGQEGKGEREREEGTSLFMCHAFFKSAFTMIFPEIPAWEEKKEKGEKAKAKLNGSWVLTQVHRWPSGHAMDSGLFFQDKEKAKVKEKAEKEPKTKDTKDKEKKVRFRSTNVNLFSIDSTFQRFIKSQRPKKRRRAERPTQPVPRDTGKKTRKKQPH